MIPSWSAEVKLKNFSLVADGLRRLGVSLSSTCANKIICQEKGEAAKLLLRLRGKLEKLEANRASLSRHIFF